jgi:hypothetical protein
MASPDDINSTLKGIVTNLANIVSAISSAASVIGPIGGSFTLSNATVTVVPQPAILAGSVVIPYPTNATAALTERTAGLYVSNFTVGTSFSVSTQTGVAVGSETFSYVLFNTA